ncbi:MAG: hypothetical protein GF405_03975 [Candidatus Eisenbacteria bacterium]|nr:hypothetical protein [Candidatus Eisenbacteria bacterium]
MRALLVLSVVLAALPAWGAPGTEPLEDVAARWLTGSFSSAAQAEADTNYFDIRLETVPVWTDRDDGHWLYVEQAAAAHRERPYRQRVYHVVGMGDTLVRSEVYAIPDPLRFAGAWADDEPLAALTPDSLDLREGCAVYLRMSEQGHFVGGTVGTGCSSTLGGAAYAGSMIVLTPDRLESWDRGFDEHGEQVWGAETGPYVFERIRERPCAGEGR